jgi:flagellar hook protein FlgE
MLNSVYTGLAGMLAYSRGLDVISNNVANLNTPGFKSSEALFRDLVFQSRTGAMTSSPSTTGGGSGVTSDTTRTSFRQGELRTTGNPLDASIDGSGFFILEQNGQLVYTRVGQFEVDKDGFVIDRRTKAKVMFTTDGAAAGPINIEALRTMSPKPTSEVTLVGNLAREGTTTTFDTTPITIVDSSGGKRTVTVKFVRDATDPLKWTVEVRDDKSAVIGTGALNFGADGTPAAADARVSVTITPTSGTAFDVAFVLGKTGSFSGLTSLSGTSASQVQSTKQNGIELGTLTQFAFTDKGDLKLSYSNGETKEAGRVLLARFDTPDQLTALGDGLFAGTGSARPIVGAGLSTGLGRIVGGQVELSNVDLTEQFTDLIIIQRGFQASSQMTSVASEMMQQLIDMSRQR